MDLYRFMFPVRLFTAVLVLALLMPAAGLGQFQTGNVFGTVMDSQGQPLPGVTVTLSGVGAPQTFITGPDGRFRFLSLAAGRYTIKAELSGFGSITRSAVDVNIGRNTEIEMTLAPALEQAITVTAETPLLDVRRAGTGATVTEIELEKVPTARDPWVILQQVPGVVVDRINVGGNESGQQSIYVGKGTHSDQGSWNVDGVNITDMGATGSSPTYYDFDAFEEMQVTTGGTDPRIATPGVSLNMVTKRGTNDLNGSGRFFFTDGDYQADPEIPAEASSYLTNVNEIDNIQDYGLEIGGPIVRDRLWLWGAYGKQEIDLLVASNFGLLGDATVLENWNGKLNAQITNDNSGVFLWTLGDKIKDGRGAAPDRPRETTWAQSGPTELFKLEDTHIFSPSFYLTGLISHVDGGFGLEPIGGRDANVFRDPGLVWHGSFFFYETERPQDLYHLDGSSFFNTGSLNHELKFGFGYRDTPVTSASGWPGTGNMHLLRSSGALCGAFDLPTANCSLALLTREANRDYAMEQMDFYLGDTILFGDLTLQAGLRFQRSTGQNLASSVRANPALPALMPAVSFPGDDQELEWESVTPRLGATYAFGTTRRTLVRAAYNQYAGQLGAETFGVANPFAGYGYLIFLANDLNADQAVQTAEVSDILLAFGYMDPDDPGADFSTTRLDYNMDPPTTDEFILGVEQEILPEFTVALNYTHRVMNDLLENRPEKGRFSNNFYTSADYEVADTLTGTLPNGEAFSVPYYRLRSGIDPPTYSVLRNRPDYEQTYDGIELLATKRLSNRWMLRGSITWNDWTQSVGPGAIWDPTPELRTDGQGCTTCDDEIVFEQALGSGTKADFFINSRWTFALTGMYQLPLGFAVGANLNAREGFPSVYTHDVTVPEDETIKEVILADLSEHRNDDVFNLDLRLSKEFIISGVGLTLSADVFNVTDERTVLARQHKLFEDLDAPLASANFIRELQSPRIFRLGARVSF